MSPRPIHCQLAVAMFSDMQTLHRTFGALLDIGLKHHQLCLLGLKPTMVHLLSGNNQPEGIGDSLRGTTQELVDVPRLEGQDMVVATSAAVLQALLNAEKATDQLARPIRGPRRPQLNVRSQLQDGSVALIAQSTNAAQHQTIVHEMLGSGGASVTTHQGPFIAE